jgi:beta-lactamase regulating signal transducer with metallopeptidase domain
MENYLYISTTISLIVLILLKYGKGTSTANYYLSSLAIVSWLIPYPYLAELIPKEALIEPVAFNFSTLTSDTIVNSKQSINLANKLWLKWGLWALFSIGVLLLVNRLKEALVWQNKIKKDPTLILNKELSAQYQLTIYSVDNISNGLLVGILSPVIIISKLITDPKHIALIITHEKQHLVNKDNIRLTLLEIVECLFWWNPLVRLLITMNRFLIEVRCDEKASKKYGRDDYIEDLASLILLNHRNKPNNFVCTATSHNQNNITRIKLLKEKRIMTFRKKLTYAMIAFTTVTTMSWNTLATATSNEAVQQVSDQQEQLGALVDFDAMITNNKKGNSESTYHYQVTLWMNFDKKSTIKIGEDFTINFKANDLGESVFLEYELIESRESKEEIISKPKLTSTYGKEITIEINNPQVSEYAYLIKSTTLKATNPSSSDK